MDFFVGLLLKNWKLVLLGTALSAALLAVKTLIHQRDTVRAELAEIQRVATEAKEQAEKNLETIQRAVPVMVAQVKQYAERNYCDRYPDRCVHPKCSPVSVGLRLPNSGGQVASPTIAYEPAGERLAPDAEFIEACARDAGRLQLWQQLCRLDTQLCEVK
jgi:hypothetical protein